jgi:hypothetical protein
VAPCGPIGEDEAFSHWPNSVSPEFYVFLNGPDWWTVCTMSKMRFTCIFLTSQKPCAVPQTRRQADLQAPRFPEQPMCAKALREPNFTPGLYASFYNREEQLQLGLPVSHLTRLKFRRQSWILIAARMEMPIHALGSHLEGEKCRRRKNWRIA